MSLKGTLSALPNAELVVGMGARDRGDTASQEHIKKKEGVQGFFTALVLASVLPLLIVRAFPFAFALKFSSPYGHNP